ncbi:MAG: DNA primase [Deltaproteobacteria bacterium]|nr:DNA primase [Deltaproteobacteria bacterium]
MLYTSEKIEEVLASVDLVTLIRQYVDLKRVGSSYKGLCPFHAEKSPSFSVTPEKGVFYCFGCGVGGNALNFMMTLNHLTFPEAMEYLAQRGGVSLPQPKGYSPSQAGVNKSALYAVMKKASDFFQANLWENDHSRIQKYLKERGLDLDLARNYRLGLSLDQWEGLRSHLKKAGCDDQLMVEAGLIRRRKSDAEAGFYDVFRNRLMIPVCDPEGREVAFAGRVLPGDNDPENAKYINSPATGIYKKGATLFGYHQARPHLRAAGIAFLVEGYFDLLAMVQAKVPNVVAAMGTALTQGQINLLRGQVKEVYLLFDGDAAGQRAASRALPALLNVELDGKVIKLPGEDDPDTFIRKYGAEGLYEAAEEATDILDYFAERLMAENGSSLAGQAKAIREAKDMLSRVPDAARGQMLRRKLAEKLGLEPNVLALGSPAPAKPLPREEVPAQARLSSLEQSCRSLLTQVIVHPELAKRLAELAPYWSKESSLILFNGLCQQFSTAGAIEPEKLHLEASEEMAALVSGALLSERVDNPQQAAVVFLQMAEILRGQADVRERVKLQRDLARAQQTGDQEKIKNVVEQQMVSPTRWSKLKTQ